MRHFTRATLKPSRISPLSHIQPRRPLVRHIHRSSAWSQAQSHQVRLRQPWFNWRSIGLWGFYTGTSYFALQYLLQRFVDGLEVDEDEDASADEEDEDEDDDAETVVLSLDDDDGSFIPVQTPKQLPRQNYKQSDPEWQEFVKLGNDKERQKEARQELAEKLVKTAAALKPIRQKLGKDIKWTKMWLDFTFPDQAAPEYIRRGWVLLEDGTMWSKQIIPHSQYIQMRHILWPTALYQAGKSCLRTFYDLQAIKVKNALGVDLSAREKQLQLASKVMIMQIKAKAKIDHAQEQLNQAKVEMEKKPEIQQQLQKQNAEKLGPPESKEVERADGGVSKPWEIKIPMPTMLMSSDFLIASRMFIGTLGQAWKQSKLDPMPPGCCFLVGDIELSGSQARCKMGVMAAYDPKAKSFVWVNSKPKGFWDHSQAAKGGP